MGGGGGLNSTSFTGIQFRQTFKEDGKCLFLCVLFSTMNINTRLSKV